MAYCRSFLRARRRHRERRPRRNCCAGRTVRVDVVELRPHLVDAGDIVTGCHAAITLDLGRRSAEDREQLDHRAARVRHSHPWLAAKPEPRRERALHTDCGDVASRRHFRSDMTDRRQLLLPVGGQGAEAEHDAAECSDDPGMEPLIRESHLILQTQTAPVRPVGGHGRTRPSQPRAPKDHPGAPLSYNSIPKDGRFSNASQSDRSVSTPAVPGIRAPLWYGYGGVRKPEAPRRPQEHAASDLAPETSYEHPRRAAIRLPVPPARNEPRGVREESRQAAAAGASLVAATLGSSWNSPAQSFLPTHNSKVLLRPGR
jgi:hypothetical protein